MNSYADNDGIDAIVPTTGVKLFVGQIPREMDEDTLIPYFAEFGPIIELTVIRDRLTKTHKGCAFVTYLQVASAHQAIEQLHDKIKLGHAINPLQVRIAECQVERENKLFIGMLPKTVTEEQLHDMFVKYGDLREVHIIRGPEGASKGCAFVKFVEREAALLAIEEMNNKVPDGSTRPLVIKFADVKKHGKKVDLDDYVEAQSAIGMKSSSFWQPSIQTSATPYYYPYGYPQGASSMPLPQQLMQSYVPYNGHSIAPEPSYMILNPSYHQATPVVLPNEVISEMPRTNHLSPSFSSRMDSYDRRHQNYSQSAQSVGSYEDNSSIPSSNQRAASEPEDSPQSPSRPPEGPAGANLFIYHLPRDLTDADLATLFAPFGNVISAKVFVDKKTSDSKGFGFVSYDSVESADASIASMNGFQIGSKRLKVQHKKTGDDLQTSPINQELEGYLPQQLSSLPTSVLSPSNIGQYMQAQVMPSSRYIPLRPMIHSHLSPVQISNYQYSFRPSHTAYIPNSRIPSENTHSNGLAYPFPG